MYMLADFAAKEEEVRVRQYVRNGRIVRGYTASRDVENEPDIPTPPQRRPHVMETELGVPLALVGIAGIAAIVAIVGGKNKAVVETIEKKAKVEKAVAAAKSPVLERVLPESVVASRLPQELQDLRGLYQKDKSAAMTSLYGGIDITKPEQARLKLVQMVSEAELTEKEALGVIKAYEKEGLVAGVFKDTVDRQISPELTLINNTLMQKYKAIEEKGLSKSAAQKEIKKITREADIAKELLAYDAYGKQFAALGEGNTGVEKKQFLLLQEYLADNQTEYKKFKDYILGGSLLQGHYGRPSGFSSKPENAVADAFVYGYNTEDFARFNTKFGGKLRTEGFAGIQNIYKREK